MPGDETRQLHSDESDSEVEEEEEIPFVEVDVTKLTALSPEVISKQVCLLRIFRSLGTITDWLWWTRPQLTWVCFAFAGHTGRSLTIPSLTYFVEQAQSDMSPTENRPS